MSCQMESGVGSERMRIKAGPMVDRGCNESYLIGPREPRYEPRQERDRRVSFWITKR